MKKIVAAAMSILLGAFGYTITDKATDERISNLEASVSSMQEEMSNLHACKPSTEDVTTTKNNIDSSNTTNIQDDFTNDVNGFTTDTPSTGLSERAVLPNVIGLSFDEAVVKIEAAGFKNISFGGIGDIVISQYPFSDTAYPTNITITLYLSE